MFASLPDLVDEIADGALVGVPADDAGVAMAATRELIRRGARDLRLFCLPRGGLAVDVLVGAGCVAEIETAAVALGEHRPAPCFTRALETGRLRVADATGPALHARLAATERGVPFMPMRGLIGSDVLAGRPDWRVVDDPLAEAGEPLVLLPAVELDVALFHCPAADAAGNLWIGRRRELATLARAAERTLATCEEIVPGSFFADERDAAGALSSLDVDAIALAPMGARPLALAGHYGVDADALDAYAEAARSEEGFRAWLDHALGQAVLA
ncbi:MAG: CoA synthetase [Alphaproteobacteria bacterium]|jgi:glutaconate CoA-transferase subunit A|nr:CoA synthetase [Alphaproteobacteria bacterium]